MNTEGIETAPTPDVDVTLERKTPPPIPTDVYNLVPYLAEDDAKEIADNAVKYYNKDWESGTAYRNKRDLILRLFVGDLPPKDPDFEECAQVHLPIVAQAVWRIHARIYDQRFPAKGSILNAVPTGHEDQDRADRLDKHMNWQLTSQMPEYVHEHDANMVLWLMYGSSFTYTYRDPVKRRPCVHSLQTDDVVIKYTRKSRDPNLADVPRITRRIHLTTQQLEEYEDAGTYVNVEKLTAPDDQGAVAQPEDKSKLRTTVDRLEGVEEDPMDPDAPRLIIEQHCWLKLPGQKRKKPVIIAVDHRTHTLLGLYLREDEDPIDRARYDRELEARAATVAGMQQQHQLAMAQFIDSRMQQSAMPTPGASDMTVPPQPGAGPSMAPMMPMPEMPALPPEPRPPRLVPIHFFTHYVCNYNPEGIYGLGVGMMLSGHNMAADTIMSQLVDSGTLALIPTYIHSKLAKLKKGEIRIKPGHSTEVDLMPDQLKAGFQRVEFPPPNPAMFQIVEKIEAAGEGLSGAGDILTGEVGGSRETATTTKIRSAMAMSNVTIMGRRYDKAQRAEARLIARINARTLDETEYKAVVNAQGDAIQINRADYHDDFDITFTADPRLASQPQRVEESDEVMGIVTAAIGTGLVPPPVAMALIRVALEGSFKARDRMDLVQALNTPIPPQMAAPPAQMSGTGTPPKAGNNEPETPGPQNSQAPPIPGPPPLQISPQGAGMNA